MTGLDVKASEVVDPEAFWGKSIPEPNTGCWLWTGAMRGGHPYGCVKIKGKQHRSHRVAYALAFGAVGSTQLVCHRCDNPPCANPAHLFLGTHQENMDDMKRKGRAASGDCASLRMYPESRPNGERNGKSKLTAADVLSIREQYARGVCFSELASGFGVTKPNIRFIVLRRTWRHV